MGNIDPMPFLTPELASQFWLKPYERRHIRVNNIIFITIKITFSSEQCAAYCR